MQRVKPIGLNLRKTDYEIEDGFLQESINLQWRDGSLRPIPERIATTIDLTNWEKPILHKVGDENTINVLAFHVTSHVLRWIGTITDGVYVAKSPTGVIDSILLTPGISYTILNGLLYFMGDGSSDSEQYYYQLKYSEGVDEYEVKDMYSWKDQYYSLGTNSKSISITAAGSMVATNGIILVRYALLLKSGEIVLHSPIFPFLIYAYVESPGSPTTSSPLPFDNIMTHIGVNLYDSSMLSDDEIIAVNVYATAPFYESEYTRLYDTGATPSDEIHLYTTGFDRINREMKRLEETPFYLVSTVNKEDLGTSLVPRNIILYVDSDSSYLRDSFDVTNIIISVEMNTIPAGEVMPVDNFSWHKLYGKITTFNNRLVVDNPTTVLNNYILENYYGNGSWTTATGVAKTGYNIDAEDGNIKSDMSVSNKLPNMGYIGLPPTSNYVTLAGILGYPDYRANELLLNCQGISGVTPSIADTYYKFNVSKLFGSNLSIVKSDYFFDASAISGTFTPVPQTLVFQPIFSIWYNLSDTEVRTSGTNLYTSNNRVQFSQVGDYSTFPVENSYRIGEGKVINVGANNVNPQNTDIIAPLIVGTSDGVYSMNTDPMGNNLIASITKIANIPYVSRNVLQIGGAIIFVSDKGLMSVENGQITNLTEQYFPDFGGGDRSPSTVFGNYDSLMNYIYGTTSYSLIDIVEYMRGALLAYDARRKTIWCCNPDKNFSLIYSIEYKTWGMSTFVFSELCELFSIFDTSFGECYSRYLVKYSDGLLYLLSGENPENLVKYHLLTRPIKLQSHDDFKKIERVYSRCEIHSDAHYQSFLVFGLWGKRDHNQNKVSQPLAALYGNGASIFPEYVRQDIPVGRLSGKYKSIVLLQGGYSLPESAIDGFDFSAMAISNNINK